MTTQTAPEVHAPAEPVLPKGLAASAALVSYGQGRPGCIARCPAQVDAAFKTFREYFLHPEVDADATTTRYMPMVIPVDDLRDYAAWEAHIKTFGNGARLRQKRKALARGYFVKPFAWRQFIPDIHAVNHSKAVRSGGAMRGSYLHSIEEMGGAPDTPHAVVWPSCRDHWALTFGTFIAEPGHRQGSVQVDESLVAYISLRRCGDVALYSQILGHGDHLDHGVLVLLHHEVVRWVSEQSVEGHCKGLRFLMYGGVQNGGESLFNFKRQAGFSARQLIAYRSTLPIPPA
jgi:hypothetical protein